MDVGFNVCRNRQISWKGTELYLCFADLDQHALSSKQTIQKPLQINTRVRKLCAYENHIKTSILYSLFSVSKMFHHHALLGLGQTLNFSWQGRSLDFSRTYAHFPKSVSPHQKFQIVLRCLDLRWGYVGSHESVFTVEMTLSKPTCKRTRARR